MGTASGGRKRQRRGVGFRIPNRCFRLCVRDEYGTRALDEPAVVLRPTALQREIELRTRTRQVAAIIRTHAMRSWAAYRQNLPVLHSLMSKLNGITRRYQSRRVEIGLFYLAPKMIGSRGLAVLTHLDDKSDFLKRLWKRKRQERKVRENSKQGENTVVPSSPAQESVMVRILRLCGMRHVLGLFAVTILACLIVLV